MKQTNTWQANAWDNSKSPDNSSIIIVNSKDDIACWTQPIRFLAQHS